MKGHRIRFDDAELAWIEARRAMSRPELHAEFCEVFGRGDVSAANLTGLCKRRGWTTGRDGRFVPGQAPANKGQKMPFNANSARTQFQPGNRTGTAARNYKPIGTERLTREGYLERKIHDGLPLRSRWRAVHLLRWEEAHGRIPAGMCLKRMGEKLDTDPANWRLIPRAMLPRLNGRYGRNFDQIEPELKPMVMAVTKLEHRAREARRGCSQAAS